MAARGLYRAERRCALLLANRHGIGKVYQTPGARLKSADRAQDRRRLFAAISAVLNDRHRGNGARHYSPRFLHRDLDLRGVEASILPDIPSVPTNVTTIMVAERIPQNCAREQERSRRCLVLERKRSHQFGLALPRSIISHSANRTRQLFSSISHSSDAKIEAREALLPHPNYLVPYARSPASPRPGTMNARSSRDS